MTSTPGNLRLIYSEASVLSTLILNGHSAEYKVHSRLFNKEVSFTTLGGVLQFLDIDCLAALMYTL